MSLQPWLLFLHVTGAMVWLGGGATIALLALREQRRPYLEGVPEFASVLSYLGLRLFTPAVVIVLATGLTMVFDGSGWRLSQAWILIGLALFVLAFLIGAVYLSRVAIALQRAASEPGAAPGRAATLIRRWLVGYGAVLLILTAEVWDMIFKP